MIALGGLLAGVQPSVDPAVDYVRALPWAPAVLATGGLAVIAAILALTRRHPGEAALALGLVGAAVGLVLVELGRAGLAFGTAGIGLALAAGAALVAGIARRIPAAPRLAPGNEQRLLALGVVGLIAAAVTIAGLAVDWPAWDPPAASAVVVGGVLGSVGLVGLLTRRHWVSLGLAATVCGFGLVILAAALPARGAGAFAGPFLVWTAATGVVALALAAAALERGHGPWVEPLEEDES